MAKKIKNRLKELRIKHNYTLDDVEKLTGIKRGTYNNYENGNTEPKLETWKKLADFFDVPVSYLQGIEPDFSKVTVKTKEFIISELDKNYFNDNKDREYKNSRSKLKQAVDEYATYAKLDPKPIKIKTDNDKNRFKYWSHHFSFLFTVEHLISWVNRYIYFTTNNYKSHLTYSHFIFTVKDMIKAQTLKEFQTDIGLLVNDKAKNRLENAFSSFERRLNFSKNINDLNAQFNSYIDFLNDLQSELNESIKNADFKLWAKKKRLENTIGAEYIDLLLHGSIRFDKEDKRILSEKYGDNAWIAVLRQYKLKNKQDVTEIDKYLGLLGIKDEVLNKLDGKDNKNKN
ncbi:helix-turn-helix transcriptional regulator [Lactobacillus helveticus]|uniref:helix-turn-helix transcriptional regulator n=1 Tax=Lactobacillus helveticus TaxID=1587 RepID=UPI001563940A|nr:helix-turn-helix transcriptional regulator [Lactobacillus helveticus]NRO78503.1 HTH-type transcriptional regulator Xre [Lactobacillus helveticus]